MSNQEKRVIRNCFNNNTVGEDCDDCLAHPSNDPDEHECCYGSQHEHNDKECRACEYETNCSRLTHGRSPAQRRIITRSSTRKSTSFQLRRKNPRRNTESLLVDETPCNRTPVEELPEEAEETFMKRLSRVTGWGMIEGGLQMALSFFQKNRPE